MSIRKKRIVTRLSCAVLLFLVYNKGMGQSFLEKSHIGMGVGAMKYRGDIRDPYTKFAFQGNYTYELTDHLHIRAQAFLGSVGASDASTPIFAGTDGNGSYSRPHPFNSRIQEASLLVEYSLLNMNGGSKWTPYVFAGVGMFHYTPYYTVYDSNTNRYNDYKYYATDKRNKPNIPFGGGIRYGLTDNIRLNLETNVRYTTTNDLDGYNPPKDGKDFYYSFTFGISFRLGGDYSSKTNAGKGSRSKSRNGKNCPPVYL